ncbi:alpha/beta-hydrolase [Trametes sanguinea]|nr:alpha/beta-hydrolase [Trametes sanguinea]
MKSTQRLASWFRGKKKMPTPPAAEAVTSLETISPLPADLLTDDMKTWAQDAGVALSNVEGVWWRLTIPSEEGALAKVLQDGGLVGLYLHGGGYVLGSAKDVRSGFARIPRGLIEHRICSSVLAVEYTLIARQDDGHKRSFPLQILEALSAYHHLLTALSIPAERIIFIGDSAGAHLVLALQRYLSESGQSPSPRGLVLLSPWCDLSQEANRVQGLLGALPTESLASPYFSPAQHTPPSPWPPTLVYSGAQESFAQSISGLVTQLREAGVSVTSYEAPDILPRYSHDFLIFDTAEGAWPDEVRQCWARIKAWTEELRSL